MFDNLKLVIPSRSRPYNQKTLGNLSQKLWPHIVMIVMPEQYHEYRAAIPIDVDIVRCDADGIGPTRQFILDLSTTGKVIMMDDDLAFYKRNISGDKFVRTTSAETVEMIFAMSRLLDRYPMVGMLDKFWAQTHPRGHRECFRCNDIHGYNRDLFPQPHPRFRVPHDEEHDMHLQLLTSGHKTAVTTEFCKSTRADRPGGCSDWRNQKVLDKAHEMLKEYWGDIVDPGPRKVRYNWKKAMQKGGLLE